MENTNTPEQSREDAIQNTTTESAPKKESRFLHAMRTAKKVVSASKSIILAAVIGTSTFIGGWFFHSCQSVVKTVKNAVDDTDLNKKKGETTEEHRERLKKNGSATVRAAVETAEKIEPVVEKAKEIVKPAVNAVDDTLLNKAPEETSEQHRARLAQEGSPTIKGAVHFVDRLEHKNKPQQLTPEQLADLQKQQAQH